MQGLKQVNSREKGADMVYRVYAEKKREFAHEA